jgi:hypothetical protein
MMMFGRSEAPANAALASVTRNSRLKAEDFINGLGDRLSMGFLVEMQAGSNLLNAKKHATTIA